MAAITSGTPTPDLVKCAAEKATFSLNSKQPRAERIDRMFTVLRGDAEDVSRRSISAELTEFYGKSPLGDVYDVHEGMRALSREEFKDLCKDPEGKKVPLVCVAGWCWTVRVQDAGKLVFVDFNDGSCKARLQIIVHEGAVGHLAASKANTGSSLRAYGTLVHFPSKDLKKDPSIKKDSLEYVSRNYEMHICNLEGHAFEVVGENLEAAEYPIAKKHISLEQLRELVHLRSRSRTIAAVMRVRSALAFATHLFFQRLGCIYLHSPVITSADCEGGSDLFQVTTMLENCATIGDFADKIVPDKEDKGKPPIERKINYSNDFFKCKAFLTSSGQLAAENYTCGMGKVYTFGPTFRSEHSHTSRHLAEFWMVEPEIDFCDLPKNMEIAEEYIKFTIQYALDHCLDDLEFLTANSQPDLIDNLRSYVAEKFVRISYTDVIDILMKHEADFQAGLVSTPDNQVKNEAGETRKTAFENPVEWGIDLASEHERFIAEAVFKKPTIIYNYPANIKAFYMRRNDDGKTCAAMDVIVPRFGELVGGSQREERRDVLEASIKEKGLCIKDYSWYLDLRTYGTIPHSGFGLGFERLVMLVTGVSNIRDVIPYPRYLGKCDS
ncbi:hypothetical protein BgAZ_209030 [Babesia gibsoni]|uniref:asparagine--tRNA ligase n=1 Tax=Babesia gibsoni TaxID=33632 RepID=A0AAD8UT56_BABGI|nr:hypothetical protein BgAZ_209030 [Babesia gibsoni]